MNTWCKVATSNNEANSIDGYQFSASFHTDPIDVRRTLGFSATFQLNDGYSGYVGTVGTITIQGQIAKNEASLDKDRWVNITSSTQNVVGPEDYILWNVSDVYYPFIRFNYVEAAAYQTTVGNCWNFMSLYVFGKNI